MPEKDHCLFCKQQSHIHLAINKKDKKGVYYFCISCISKRVDKTADMNSNDLAKNLIRESELKNKKQNYCTHCKESDTFFIVHKRFSCPECYYSFAEDILKENFPSKKWTSTTIKEINQDKKNISKQFKLNGYRKIKQDYMKKEEYEKIQLIQKKIDGLLKDHEEE